VDTAAAAEVDAQQTPQAADHLAVGEPALLVEFHDGRLGVRAQLGAGGPQGIGGLQRVPALQALVAAAAAADMDVELAMDGAARDLHLVLVRDVGLLDRPAAAGPVTVVVAVSVSVSGPLVSVMVCGVAKAVLSNTIVSGPTFAFAWATASRSEPAPVSFVLSTVNVDGTQRSSSNSTASRGRRVALRIGQVTGRVKKLRIQERFVIEAPETG
jgi:hypothetical protein